MKSTAVIASENFSNTKRGASILHFLSVELQSVQSEDKIVRIKLVVFYLNSFSSKRELFPYTSQSLNHVVLGDGTLFFSINRVLNTDF